MRCGGAGGCGNGGIVKENIKSGGLSAGLYALRVATREPCGRQGRGVILRP
jgi:hypothetical protein